MALGALIVSGGCYEGIGGPETADASDATNATAAPLGERPHDAPGPHEETVGESDGEGEAEPEPEHPDHWRRLTAVQYRNSVLDLIGVEVDTSGFLADSAPGHSPFPSNAGVAPQALDIDQYWNASSEVASQATSDLEGLLTGCDPTSSAEADACGAWFIDTFAPRAFRRPLEPEQREGLLSLFEVGREDGLARGIELVIQAVLQSPQFLYLPEYGEYGDSGEADLAPLDGYELATRLAFLLTNSTPDDALLAAAERLEDPEELRAHALRLMETDAFIDTVVYAFMQITHISRLDTVTRAEVEFDDELRAAMQREAETYVREVLLQDGTVYGLFTTPLAIPDERLAADVYGFGSPGEAVHVEDGTRAGLLTLPAFLASSPPLETHFAVVYRGNAIRTRLLCDVLPPPAVDTAFEGAEDLTPRERLRAHQDNPGCASCHKLMDNVGFGLLNYDDIGRYVASDAEGRIDASGYVTVPGEGDLAFDDAAGLSHVLGSIPKVRTCLAKQWFRFALGRDPDDADAPSLEPVAEILSEGDGDLREAILALVTSDSFRLRRTAS